MTIWPNVWRHALTRGGLTLRDMRVMLADNGLVLTEVENIPQWPPGDEYLDIAAELGAQTVVAMRLDGAPLDAGQDAEQFARFADSAKARGLRSAVEFVAFGGLRDAAAAWELVRASGCPDTGIVVDIAHHVRSGRDDAALFAIPAERIVAVQAADGPALAPADLREEAATGRLWLGEGDFDVAGYIARLAAHGVRASIGLELYRPDFADRDSAGLIAELAVRTRQLLAATD